MESSSLEKKSIDLRKKFENAVTAERDWRELAEMYDRYYDGDQFTAEEISYLEERNIPAIVVNEIAPAVDRILGEEEVINFDWKVSPFEDTDDKTAQVVSQLLKHIRETSDLQYEISDWFKDGVVVGRSLLEVFLEDNNKINVTHVPWREWWLDPYSKKYDLSDARYLCRAKWIPIDVAKEEFGKKVVEAYNSYNWADEDSEDTDNIIYIDKKKERAKIVEIWYFEKKELKVAYFCGDTLLRERDDIYGLRCYPFIPYFVKRDYKNRWYGLVKNMLSSQDEINHRHSKALQALDTRRVIMERGAIDPNIVAEEASRPDAIFEIEPGKEFQIQDNVGMSEVQFQLMTAAENRLRRVGGLSNEFLGLESNAISGRAITARSNESRKTQGRIFGNIRRSQLLLGKLLLKFVGKYYTEQKAFRITNQKGFQETITINEKVYNPETGKTEVRYGMAGINYDLILSQVPADPNTKHVQLEMLVNLIKAGVPVPPEMIIRNMDIDMKEELLQKIQEIQQQQSQPTPQEQLEMQKTMAEIKLILAQAQRQFEDAKKSHEKALRINVEIRQMMQEIQQQSVALNAIQRALESGNVHLLDVGGRKTQEQQ